jgi:hypothetical protein
MLTGVHFLLTYQCTYECDHCFLYCGPRAEGTFTLEQLRQVYAEVDRIPSVEWIYFEGGEPFLYYPLMIEGMKMARARGLKIGIVTNNYWATAVEDAELWLRSVKEIEIEDLSLSDDEFHSGEDAGETPAAFARAAAEKLEMPVETICIDRPTVECDLEGQVRKGAPVIGGSVRMRGRAVDKLIDGLPRRKWTEFQECPYEDLIEPGRVHIDAFGHVHVCQGISIGNMWETPLSEIVSWYDPERHPVCGPLVSGGPALLSEQFGIRPEEEYVDECHFCYLVRRELIDQYPGHLAPRQVYGLEQD